MNSKLYVVSENNANEATKTSYKEELDLQVLIANNPQLIARDRADTKDKLYLLSREKSTTAKEDKGNAFSLDHLMVDSNGVPVLVEVKRSSDTRIRREVVAQMLDYACRAASYDVDRLREDFRSHYPEDTEINDNDDFWKKVSSNLRSDTMRLVFAADSIPGTLRLLIEFLDRSMPNIEVYGVEITPYDNDGKRLIISTVIGNDPDDARKNSSGSRRSYLWDRDSFLNSVRESDGKESETVARNIIEYCEGKGFEVRFGTGSSQATVNFKRNNRSVFCIVEKKESFCVEFSSQWLSLYDTNRDLFSSVYNDVRKKFNSNKDRQIRITNSFIYIPLAILTDEEAFKSLENILNNLL